MVTHVTRRVGTVRPAPVNKLEVSVRAPAYLVTMTTIVVPIVTMRTVQHVSRTLGSATRAKEESTAQTAT